ncbi:MAG: hypothetical protein V2G41_10050 [bacterium JZ-2024 1]
MDTRIMMKPIAVLFVALPCSPLMAAVGEGFGITKMRVELNRKRPPLVYIMGTAICVEVKSQVPKGPTLTQPMASMLEAELCRYDRRLKPECTRPETIISCTITELSSDEKTETRTERQQVGERQVWNEKKQRYEKEPVYGDVQVPYKIVTGAMNVSYQAKDKKTGKILDSANIRGTYSEAYRKGEGAPSLNEVEQMMMRNIIAQIVPRLVPTIERVEVLLAKGSFEAASNLGKAGLWNKMLETLELMTPLKNPKDDAYRRYNIGVAYEALAYQAEDLATTRKLLEEAATNYRAAIEMNPEEKYFREPQVQIQTAIAQYKKLEQQQAAWERAEQDPGPQGKKGTEQQPQGPTQQGALTNQDIVDLKKEGLDEENLISMINTAPRVQFDLSPEGVRYLLKNGISNKVIAAMRARQFPRQRPPRQTQRKKTK